MYASSVETIHGSLWKNQGVSGQIGLTTNGQFTYLNFVQLSDTLLLILQDCLGRSD